MVSSMYSHSLDLIVTGGTAVLFRDITVRWLVVKDGGCLKTNGYRIRMTEGFDIEHDDLQQSA